MKAYFPKKQILCFKIKTTLQMNSFPMDLSGNSRGTELLIFNIEVKNNTVTASFRI